MRYRADKALLIVDLLATLVFAVEGGMAAVTANLDFFGILVLAGATGLGGGTIRDLLIGAVPPASIREWRYALTAFVGGAVAFFLHQFVRQIPGPVMIGLDAAGLSLCAVAGAAKALDFKINPLMAALMGTITGVGGGTIRDILLSQVPAVLQVEIYAVAALAGSVVMLLGMRFGMSRTLMMWVGAVACFLLRIVSLWQNWNLPKAVGQ
jgi:uncharacterized membrane protein YeiH